MSMANDKSSENNGRILYQSEIFKDGPKAASNYASSIGAEQGLEVFGGEQTLRRDGHGPQRRISSRRARSPSLPRRTCSSSAAARPAPLRPSRPARLGADVLLVERYNHLGGLSTGGLVIWIDRMSDWAGKHIIRGFASDIMDRLPKDAVQGPQAARLGLQGRRARPPTGRNGPLPSTASSPGRPRSIRKR